MMLLFLHILFVSVPGCFSKDQVYLDGILRILRHRKTIDFKTLTSLGKVSVDTFKLKAFIPNLHSAQGKASFLPNFCTMGGSGEKAAIFICINDIHRWTSFTSAGVLWRRGEAAAPGGVVTDQNPSLHARPGAVPATSGPHRRCQRTGWLSAARSAALTVGHAPEWRMLVQTASCGALNITANIQY